MKLVYIIGGAYAPNGMSKILCQKVNFLAKHTNYDIYIVLTEKANYPLYYQLEKKVNIVNFDINFDELDTMPILNKIYYYQQKQIKYKQELTNYLIKLKADIVVSAMRRDINFLNDIKDGSQKIGEIHFNKSNYRDFNKPYLPKWLNTFITNQWRGKLIKEINKLKHFIVLSHEDKAEWTELQNIDVIPNPINFIPKEQSTCTQKRVIAAGRYTWQKGFDLLIDSWKIVNLKNPDWELHIYGSGNNQFYQEFANKKGLGKVVTCHPATSNIIQEFQNSSIFVLSSRYEGFGLVLVEAMSCGLPCVSFACPCGPKDIITDGKNGYLVEPNNIEALAERICHLIEHEELRKEMGKEARKRAEDFTEEKIMKQWVDLFENIQS